MICLFRGYRAIAALVIVSAAPLHGQCREARLGWEPYPDAQTVFHSDVAIDGEWAAVARKSTGSNGVITMHRLVGGEWMHTQALSNPVGANSLQGKLSLANGWLAVGDSHVVFLFAEVAGTWEYRGLLDDPSGSVGFGESVDFNDDATRIVVGNSNYDHGGLDSVGRVDVFERSGSTWTAVALLLSSVPESDSRFGHAVSTDGNHVIVGAYGAAPKGVFETFVEVGGVWQFERRYRQVGPAPTPGGFGWDVDLDGDRAVVGAPFGTPNRAYVYRFDSTGWNVEYIAEGATGAGGEFGQEVHLDGERLAVSEHGNEDEVEHGGAVFLYRRTGTTWNPTTVLRAADSQPNVAFGARMAVSGERVVVSGSSSPARRIGGVYAFTGAWTCPTPNFGTLFCVPGAPNSTGQGARLEAHGSPFVADGLLGLWADSLPPHEFSLLIASTTTSQVPFGAGTLCLGGDIARIQDQIQTADALGRAHFCVRLDLVPTNPGQPILVGETWRFQCYYRDVNGAPTFNLSDAIAITFQ